ncbi:hypothetical protein UCRPC4_g01325 [Phaeomoniella chlamydospora]|uniref:J domain-containing protein n=1 Tax=Phaeomoniella chlamydospora TaxID=158046 RepID=A0A0G2HEY1_PHACM|nr:hypothetical protein UCRPC4_g01325 [Phaeomoniella chlamydospora]
MRAVAKCVFLPVADHEIFRLRDEVASSEGEDITFYDFVGVTPSASLSQIEKAYRKKARQIHPDKVKQSFIASRAAKKSSSKKPTVHVNKPPTEKEIKKAVKDANDRFSKLGVVKNILSGPGRDRYDHFLKHGFPKWRGTGYYYTRFRPGLGSVLIGLFIFGGGAVHYGILVLSYKRQRDFVERYIRYARRAAWGDDSALGGIPGLDGSMSPPIEQAEAEPGSVPMNRKQKRAMEKGNKKEKTAKKPTNRSGISTPTTSIGPRRRVTAENGKILIVEASGNVWLEEEIDGEVQEFLLDVDEIQRPSFRNTAVYRLPIWIYNTACGKVRSTSQEEDDEGVDEDVNGIATAVTSSGARKRNKKNGVPS